MLYKSIHVVPINRSIIVTNHPPNSVWRVLVTYPKRRVVSLNRSIKYMVSTGVTAPVSVSSFRIKARELFNINTEGVGEYASVFIFMVFYVSILHYFSYWFTILPSPWIGNSGIQEGGDDIIDSVSCKTLLASSSLHSMTTSSWTCKIIL